MAQVMYLDETPVVALVTLLNNFCSEQNRYFRYGTNHWAMFKSLRTHDNHISSVGARIGVDFPKNRAPQELIDAMQEFFIEGKKSDATLRRILEVNIEHHAYRAKYALTNQEQLKREFERFRVGIVKYVNQVHKKNGIRMMLTRPKKG